MHASCMHAAIQVHATYHVARHFFFLFLSLIATTALFLMQGFDREHRMRLRVIHFSSL
jgi:hypothetical protein